MKFNYYPETDSLYISLNEKPSTDSQEVSSGIVLDFDREGNLVGIDIDHASQVVDLTRLEAEALPVNSIGQLLLTTQQKIIIAVVVHTDRDGKVRLISARKASKRERKIYEQQSI